MKLRIAIIWGLTCIILASGCARASSTVNPAIYNLQPTSTTSAPTQQTNMVEPISQPQEPKPSPTAEPQRNINLNMSAVDRLLDMSDVENMAPTTKWARSESDYLGGSLALSSDDLVTSAKVSFDSMIPAGAHITSFCVEFSSVRKEEGISSSDFDSLFPARREYPLLTDQTGPISHVVFRDPSGPYFYVFHAKQILCAIAYVPQEDEAEYTTLAMISRLGKAQLEKSLVQ